MGWNAICGHVHFAPLLLPYLTEFTPLTLVDDRLIFLRMVPHNKAIASCPCSKHIKSTNFLRLTMQHKPWRSTWPLNHKFWYLVNSIPILIPPVFLPCSLQSKILLNYRNKGFTRGAKKRRGARYFKTLLPRACIIIPHQYASDKGMRPSPSSRRNSSVVEQGPLDSRNGPAFVELTLIWIKPGALIICKFIGSAI